MATREQRSRMRRARSLFMTAEREIANAAREVLRARHTRCHPTCRGFFAAERDDTGSLVLERCDECANLNGYASLVFDDDLYYLPEAKRALRVAVVAREKAMIKYLTPH